MEQNFPNRSHVFCVFCQMCNFIASNKCETKTKVKHPKHYESSSKGIGDAESCETLCKRESSAGTNERSLVTMPPIAEPRRGPLMITSYGLDNDWHLKTPPKKTSITPIQNLLHKNTNKAPHTQEQKGDLHNHRKSKLKVVVIPSQNEGFYNAATITTSNSDK